MTFYKAKWSVEVDPVLLFVIVRANNMARWRGTVILIPILQEVVESIESETGVSFSWHELYEKFRFLEQHFYAFKLVRHTHGVYWNMQSNTVSFPKTSWKDLIKWVHLIVGNCNINMAFIVCHILVIVLTEFHSQKKFANCSLQLRGWHWVSHASNAIWYGRGEDGE